MDERSQARQDYPEPPEQLQYRMFAGMSGPRLRQPLVWIAFKIPGAQVFFDRVVIMTRKYCE
jgi:hypothetical protein